MLLDTILFKWSVAFSFNFSKMKKDLVVGVILLTFKTLKTI